MTRPVDDDDEDTVDDYELARRGAAGDRPAIDLLTERHRPRLVRLLTGLLWDADEAETVTQETFVRILEKIGEYRPEHEFRAWLTGIGINLARNVLRSRARRAAVTDPTLLSQQSADEGRKRGVLSGILKRELHEQLYAAIDQLPVSLREAFVLHELEGLSFGEIAQLTNVAEGTLRVRAHRAKALLREALGSAVETWWQKSEHS
jgi:RNA polymerase sigma-70 factor, ECF subfamily